MWLTRFTALPRREFQKVAEKLIDPMTAWLKTPHGTMRLNSFQAGFLAEIIGCRGGYGLGRVGVGKTLVCALAPTVLGARRPLLLVPGKHLTSGKTQREINGYRQHFHIIPNGHLRIESYEQISTTPEMLDNFKADCLILDECHRVKAIDGGLRGGSGSARARRVDRWICANPQVPIVCLTGTGVRSSFLDYSHQLVWTLRNRAPVPLTRDQQRDWALCLDEPVKRNDYDYPNYDAFSRAIGCRVRTLDEARDVFQHLLRNVYGVAISSDRFNGDLELSGVYRAFAGSEGAFTRLRSLWEMPDGWCLADKAMGVWNAAQQLALGFFYEPRPRPPESFVKARRDWAKFCRQTLEGTNEIDTETQVRDLCLVGILPADKWQNWHYEKSNFQCELEPRWLHYEALQWIFDWGRKATPERGSIVWVSHRAVGEKLSELTGWPFFKNQGMTATKRAIDMADPKRKNETVIIASRYSCGDGFNLQRYNRNLFVTPSKSGLDWEQEIGRTHRDGQTRPVTVDCLISCLETADALPSALGYARYYEQTVGLPQKLLQAHLNLPPSAQAPDSSAFKQAIRLEEIAQ
jgi:hypothetical protein